MISHEQIQICPQCGAKYLRERCPRCGREFLKIRPMPTQEATQEATQEDKSGMNKTEVRYAQRLGGLIACGAVQAFAFEGLTVRLAKRTRYTPDFLVVLPDGRLELHEIKGGHIWDDSKVKFKVAREMYPWFVWRMLQWKHAAWVEIL